MFPVAIFLSFQHVPPFLRCCFFCLLFLGQGENSLGLMCFCMHGEYVSSNSPFLLVDQKFLLSDLGPKGRVICIVSTISFQQLCHPEWVCWAEMDIFSLVRLSAYACETEESTAILNTSLEQGRLLSASMHFCHQTSCLLTASIVLRHPCNLRCCTLLSVPIYFRR